MVACAGECSAEYVLRATVGYTAFGALVDAIDTHRQTIYEGRGSPKRVALGVKLRF
jgi:hypothetical protein